MAWFLDSNGDGMYDTAVLTINDKIVTSVSGNITEHQRLDHYATQEEGEEDVARALASAHGWTFGISTSGAAINSKVSPSHNPDYEGSGDPTEYGIAALKKSDFFEVDGITPKHEDDILELIKPHKPGISDEAILAQIRDTMPKLEEVPEEEKGFAREGFQKDVYGISKPGGIASKAGTQMQQAYGSGMGASMRGAYGAQKDVSQQFKQAEQGYAEDIYGLEQKKVGEFEGRIGTWLQGFRQGGRVPSNKGQTFSQVLSRIPDAGGT